MKNLTIQEMQQMQTALQQRYLKKWGGLSPEVATQKLLWLYGELGEASDVIKKSGNDAISHPSPARQHFIEEMCDALMYFHDVLLCYQITSEEFTEIYRAKFHRNMERW